MHSTLHTPACERPDVRGSTRPVTTRTARPRCPQNHPASRDAASTRRTGSAEPETRPLPKTHTAATTSCQNAAIVLPEVTCAGSSSRSHVLPGQRTCGEIRDEGSSTRSGRRRGVRRCRCGSRRLRPRKWDGGREPWSLQPDPGPRRAVLRRRHHDSDADAARRQTDRAHDDRALLPRFRQVACA